MRAIRRFWYSRSASQKATISTIIVLCVAGLVALMAYLCPEALLIILICILFFMLVLALWTFFRGIHDGD